MLRLLVIMLLAQLWPSATHLSAQNATEESLRHELSWHAAPLHTSGEALLLKEAQEHQYFLLGELHGEVEIPELLSDLWPSLWRAGYRHVAAEVSPWAATHLQRSEASGHGIKRLRLHTLQHRLSPFSGAVISRKNSRIA